MKKNLPAAASTDAAAKPPLVRRLRPVELDDQHPYVVLPDGRVAKVCSMKPYGRQMRIGVKLRGRKDTQYVDIRRVRLSLGWKPAANSNPNAQ